MQVIHGVLNKKPAGTMLNIRELKIGVAMVGAHAVARIPRTMVHMNSGDKAGACQNLIYHLIPPATIDKTVKFKNNRVIFVLLPLEKM
jgi:hypothetical protein